MAESQSQPNKSANPSLPTQPAAPQGIESAASTSSDGAEDTKNLSVNDPIGHHHVHWASGIPSECQNEMHDHLHKIKSPPPGVSPELSSREHSLIDRVTQMHPIADIEAKSKDLMHATHLHSGKAHGKGD